VIVVTATTAGDRRRFSVAHELGHLVLHQVPQGSPHAVEQQADLFAAAFLLPEAAMRQVLVPPITLTTLADLKEPWGVSLQALIRRARTLERMTPSHYRALSAQLGARGWRTQEPLEVPVERPRALRQLAELLYGVPIDYPQFARAIGLDPRFLQDLLEAHAAGYEGVLSHISICRRSGVESRMVENLSCLYPVEVAQVGCILAHTIVSLPPT
jgi:hypothetical protein